MNIIFDIGGVVLNWSYEIFLSHNFSNENDKDAARKHIVNTPLWRELDKGTITHENAVRIGAEKSGLPESAVDKLLHTVPDVLQPINETIDIIKELKSKNHKLYVLSNMSENAANSIEKKYDFWKFFDDIMFSGRVKMVKPDDEIFHHIAELYNLEIENTVFIDDTEENVGIAKKLGFKTILFNSPEQCRDELEKMNCL